MKLTEYSNRHIVQWDCRIEQNYNPLYFLAGGGRLDRDPIPPVDVRISATFDTNDSALEFERKVRELLGDA